MRKIRCHQCGKKLGAIELSRGEDEVRVICGFDCLSAWAEWAMTKRGWHSIIECLTWNKETKKAVKP